MNTIHAFLIALKKQEGAIWAENGSLKLSTPVRMQNQETKNFLTENKAAILSLLQHNSIFTKADFEARQIFSDTISTSYPLSFEQERLWFIEKFEQGTNAYNVPDLYELKSGTTIEGLKFAILEVVKRHEVLRTTIVTDETGKAVSQKVHTDPLNIEEVSLRDSEDYYGRIKKDVNRPFNLCDAYPIRVVFYHIRSSVEKETVKTLLLINIHHIACDGFIDIGV